MKTMWQYSENCFQLGIQYTPEHRVARVFLGWWIWVAAFRGPVPIGYRVDPTETAR